MGRLGPLTSMALGRSPYDDVVSGEGERDPRAPLQMYDERGRPVNPETKRVNRDVIRSHNEVMLVIGVVESESSIDELKAEHLRRCAHERYDDKVGRNLGWAARVFELGGVWGVGGMRQRILLYRQYSHVPFSRLFSYEHTLRSPTSLWLHGMPAFVAAQAMDFSCFSERVMRSMSLKLAFSYLQTSLKIWYFLQRTGLFHASDSQWFPDWKYFIPFSSSSAISPRPLPSSISVESVAGWLGGVALNAVPFVAFWAVGGLWLSAVEMLHEEIYDWLPNPSNPKKSRKPTNGFVLQRVATDRDPDPVQSQPQTNTEPPTSSEDVLPIHTQPAESQESSMWDLPQSAEHFTTPEDFPSRTARDGNTLTSRPEPPTTNTSRPRSHPRRSRVAGTEEFSSDDEANEEVVSATLISFDVENNPDNQDLTGDSNLPPGIWAAELRPNPASESHGGGGDSDGRGRDGDDDARRTTRLYRDNALTQLPANIGAGILARRISSIALAPLEASAMREIAWTWCRARGRPTDAMWEPSWFWPFTIGRSESSGLRFDFRAGLSWGSVVNLVGLEIVHLLFDACLLSLIPLAASQYLVTDEDWERQRKEAAKRAQQRMNGLNDRAESVQLRDESSN